MGTPDFSVGIMEKMLEQGIQLVGCVTVADKPAGRGQQLHESPVKRFALEHAIPVLQPLKLKDEAFLEELRALKADVFVVVAFRMLPAEVWKMPRFGTFNLHASLLPDYRGAAPINWAIINGDKQTGVSTFFIDEAIDTGNVIAQTKMDIAENETAGSLHDRMMVTGGELVVQTIQAIEAGTVQPIPQEQFKDSLMRPAPKLFRENTQIDWSKPVREIHQLICGLSPYPAAWTRWVNSKGEIKQVKLYKTTIEDSGSIAIHRDGIVNDLSSDKHTIKVHCTDGILVIQELQMEGKKRMSARDWLVGNSVSDWSIEA
ncbi:MAG: methionyl-tRNA formyltransferase [Candidatus Fluviicola riflensis]|nr:MAG: methionyl-tRNA formyltransferase [Candidatus Fluviicola riflensis]OGS87176.1 MAG: methionyl-tRNA formyltransferase [Fluviicola sp. RIFCSPHIGHO2_01_FULL_43_53]OGS89964.1 MAG: methionyl-tRNA formyltransferase [Fluviicola sp. RIFCSPHIGHO2_12_FULL_43_24]